MARARDISGGACSRVARFLFFILCFRLVLAKDSYISSEDAERLVKRSSAWWFANIPRQGTVAYGNSSWVLFRNVMDFGAVGDGIADDTAALTNAMMLGPRCVGQYNPMAPCQSSTITPAIVYIPPGTYRLFSAVVMPYNTIVIGDAVNMPMLLADSSFQGIGLLDPDPYYSGGASWYANQNDFYRQVRNIIFDITQMPIGAGHCIHWQVAQATSLQNLVFNMAVGGGANNMQMGVFMDNGSGGFMRDLVFNGGGTCFLLGNQQFTSSNLTFNNCVTGVYMNWDWIWSFKDLTFNNCGTGIYLGEPSSPALGSAVLADSTFSNVDQAIVTTFNCTGGLPPTAGTLIIDNVDFTGATSAISYPNGTVILAGGQHVAGWMQGHVYAAQYGLETFPNHNNETCYVPQTNLMCVQGTYTPPTLPTGLRDATTGKIFDRGKPTYDDWAVSQFVSAKTFGCHGDGVTDDTACLQSLFNSVDWNQMAYLDHGAYVITDTILIPKNIRIMGEGWPMIMINSSDVWSDMNNPVPAIRVGNPGDVGKLEMQDIIFETRGPTPGAILVEWNLEEDAQGSAGMWDVHWRIGGSAGTLLEEDPCANNPSVVIEQADPNCYASFLLLHVTETASLYMENNWGWVSDHELDESPYSQLNIWNGRGLLVESVNPFWLVGSSFEHSQLYNYGINNAQNVYMSHIQSETAYMQSNPVATVAYPPNPAWNDPDFSWCQGLTKCIKTIGLRIYNSSYVYIYAAGLYSFFDNYDSSCLVQDDCQTNAATVDLSEAVYIWDLYTIGDANLVLMDSTPLVPQGDNLNTFGESIALFEFA